VAPVSGTKNAPMYVTIKRKIRNAINPIHMTLSSPARWDERRSAGRTDRKSKPPPAEQRLPGKTKIEPAEEAFGRKEAQTKTSSKMIKRNKGENAESPEYEGVGQTWERALLNDFGLAETSQKKVPNSLSNVPNGKIRRLSWKLVSALPPDRIAPRNPRAKQRRKQPKAPSQPGEMRGFRITESE
jgi:hypothetical protein